MKRPTNKPAKIATLSLDQLELVGGGNAVDTFMTVLKSCVDSKSETQKALARFG